jgi:hypothetical protein
MKGPTLSDRPKSSSISTKPAHYKKASQRCHRETPQPLQPGDLRVFKAPLALIDGAFAKTSA